jgi:hypothetical protein
LAGTVVEKIELTVKWPRPVLAAALKKLTGAGAGLR